jgi:2-hydroxychromene-2-carboxylate isomerase
MATPVPAHKSAGAHVERPTVTFYYDIVCPYAYLASEQIEALCERVGAAIDWRPILLGGVLKALSSTPNEGTPARQAMIRLDLDRWAEHLQVPLRMPAEHPRRTVDAMRLLCFTPPVARPALTHALYRAYWAEGRDVSSLDVLCDIAESVGLNRDSARVAIKSPAARAELERCTSAALSAGVFGVPTFVVDSPSGPRLFFGQDRLHFVEMALLAGRPEARERRRRSLKDEVLSVQPVANEARRVTFFYDFSSPFSYLASTQIEEVAARHGAIVEWHPILLGGLFRSIGTPLVPIQGYSEPKRRHTREDLVRWAHYYDEPFHWPSRFPMMTVTALRLALLAGERIGPLSHALFHAYWVDDSDLNDPAVLERALGRAGLDPGLVDQVGNPAIKARLHENTEAAREAGVFGAPSFLVQTHDGLPQLFFGQDRLLFVEKALAM